MIILVAGLPGSGKSYFASRLADEMKVEYLSTDGVRKTIHASGKYTFEDRLNVYNALSEQAEALIKNRKTVVVDAVFSYEQMRDIFYGLAAKYRIPCKLIVVTADEKVIEKRLSKPRQESEADFSVYQVLRSQYEPIITDHLVLKSEDSDFMSMYHKALPYLTTSK